MKSPLVFIHQALFRWEKSLRLKGQQASLANFGLPATAVPGLSEPEMTALVENGAEFSNIEVLACQASSRFPGDHKIRFLRHSAAGFAAVFADQLFDFISLHSQHVPVTTSVLPANCPD